MGKALPACLPLDPAERFSKGVLALFVKMLAFLCSFFLLLPFLVTIETLVTSKSLRKLKKKNGIWAGAGTYIKLVFPELVSIRLSCCETYTL